MRRRAVLALLGGAAVWVRRAQARVARAQPLRVGVLDPGLPTLFDAFFQGMRELGYVEGDSVVYLRRSTEGQAAPTVRLATELAGLKPDVIFTSGTLPVRAVFDATSTIPIVFCGLGDAVAMGVAESLARPGRNATGLSFLITEITPKRLHLLIEALPGARRIALLWDRTTSPITLDSTIDAARALGLAVEAHRVVGPDESAAAFDAAVAGHAEAMLVLPSAFFFAYRAQLADLGLRRRLPGIYDAADFVRAGGLISYGPDLRAMFRRAASFVDKIADGATPASLPIEQPTGLELAVNLKTAMALQREIPPSIVARADEVIE